MSVSDAQNQTTYTGFAVLELLGHRTRAGFVSEAMIAGAPFLRIDIPAGEETITEFYSSGSLYAMSPCDEATARLVAGRHDAGPIDRYDLNRAVEARHGEELNALREQIRETQNQLYTERERSHAAQPVREEIGDDDGDEGRDDDDLRL